MSKDILENKILLFLSIYKWSKLLLNGAEMLILTESKLKWKLPKFLPKIKEFSFQMKLNPEK